MKKIYEFLSRDKALMNIVFIFLIIIGGIFAFNLKKATIPQVEDTKLVLEIQKYNTNPQDMERLVTRVAEENLTSIYGIEKIESTTEANLARIILTMNLSQGSADEIKTNVQRRLESIRLSIPSLQRLQLTHNDGKMVGSLVLVALGFNVDEDTHYWELEHLRSQLRAINGVVKVESSEPRRSLYLEFDQAKLQSYGLNTFEVVDKIIPTSRSLGITEKSSETALFNLSSIDTVEAIREIPVLAQPQSSVLRLKDLATADIAPPKDYALAHHNTSDAIQIEISADVDADVSSVAQAVDRIIDSHNKSQDRFLKVEKIVDVSEFVKQQFDSLISSAVVGFIILFLVLTYFIGFRVTVYSASGIVISLLLTLLVMDIAGISVNILSIIGFIIVIGLLVDDSIIVSESFVHHLRNGFGSMDAAVQAVKENFGSLTASMLTTALAFSPLLIIDNEISRYFAAIPIVISIALLFSWIECFVFLPIHLSHIKPASIVKESHNLLLSLLRGIYMKMLHPILTLRWLVIPLTLVLFGIVLFLIKDQITFDSNVSIGWNRRFINIEFKGNDSFEDASKKIKDLEQALNDSIVNEHVFTETKFGSARFDRIAKSGLDYATIVIHFDNLEDDSGATGEKLNSKIENIIQSIDRTNISRIRFGSERHQALDKVYSFYFKGRNLIDESQVLANVGKRLGELPGYKGASFSGTAKAKVWEFTPDQALLSKHNISESDLASQFRSYIADTYIGRFSLESAEVEAFVLGPQDKSDKAYLDSIPFYKSRMIRLNSSDLGTWQSRDGIKKISHIGGDRLFEIHASFDTSSEPDKELVDLALQDMQKAYPDFTVSMSYDDVDTQKAKEWASSSIYLAVGALGAVLLIVLRSVLLSLVLFLVAIPIAIAGLVIVITLHGYSINLFCVLGLLGACGVALNDSLILISSLRKKLLHHNEDNIDIFSECERKFKPILLTTLTTFLGSVPTAYGWFGDVGFTKMIPFSLGWGVVFSTLATLFVLPCALQCILDLKKITKKVFLRNKKQSHYSASKAVVVD